ncbi:unnamed protein product [Phyllotreta striolata]|uniref:Uncharacterized protein n=1 Tax=Phyllotreta striolata TaxID=444603 RepID=A0A9N9TXX5_PHYSR|nr:unnamed protein product [Phyllotreta striolata]
MRGSMCSKRFLLYFLYGAFTISILFDAKMAIEGLPLHGQEPDSDQDILAGADFLSLFLQTSLRRAYAETTPTPPPTTTILLEMEDDPYTTRRSKRNSQSPFASSPFPRSTEQFSDSTTDKDGVVVAVRVSSSLGRSASDPYGDSTTLQPAPTYFSSEHHPSLVAKASKSELSVEESEPITKDSDAASDFSRNYPARVRVLPPFVHQENKPYQHPTVIFHDDPADTNSARSVSYSSIIQTIPQLPIETERSEPHERHERNYNDAKSPYVNAFDKEAKLKQIDGSTKQTKIDSAAKTTPKTWHSPRVFAPTTPLPVVLPKVYGQPEQNYEVDEALSVVTNGRAHGVQPTKPEKKPDDNQKFGYVVEGKNYRKYRVEERTADGFIVGEYGVVSHDDGSLRGVRYTADGTINPRLISEALMKFLSL